MFLEEAAGLKQILKSCSFIRDGRQNSRYHPAHNHLIVGNSSNSARHASNRTKGYSLGDLLYRSLSLEFPIQQKPQLNEKVKLSCFIDRLNL
jgi:hypothetical protein